MMDASVCLCSCMNTCAQYMHLVNQNMAVLLYLYVQTICLNLSEALAEPILKLRGSVHTSDKMIIVYFCINSKWIQMVACSSLHAMCTGSP